MCPVSVRVATCEIYGAVTCDASTFRDYSWTSYGYHFAHLLRCPLSFRFSAILVLVLSSALHKHDYFSIVAPKIQTFIVLCYAFKHSSISYVSFRHK